MKLTFLVIVTILHCLLMLVRPNGVARLAAEMILLRAQLLADRQNRKKAPPLTLAIARRSKIRQLGAYQIGPPLRTRP